MNAGTTMENLDITEISDIEDWHERFDQYCITNDKVTDANKTAFYVTFIGKKAYRLLKDLAYPQSVADMDVGSLKNLLQGHLKLLNFEAAERERFHNLTRKSDETLRSFVLRVQQQAAKCNFGWALEDQMRDRLVAGVADPEIKRKLLRESGLTFQSAKHTLEEWNDINSILQRPTEVLATNRTSHLRSKPSPRSKPAWRNRGLPSHGHRQAAQLPSAKTGTCDSCGGNHQRSTCRF